jgi:hypothetical protein
MIYGGADIIARFVVIDFLDVFRVRRSVLG